MEGRLPVSHDVLKSLGKFKDISLSSLSGQWNLVIGGRLVILGTDWMKHYSPITFDFKSFNIQILQEGQAITLQWSVKDPIIQLIREKEVPEMKASQWGHARVSVNSLAASLQQNEVTIPSKISQLLS